MIFKGLIWVIFVVNISMVVHQLDSTPNQAYFAGVFIGSILSRILLDNDQK